MTDNQLNWIIGKNTLQGLGWAKGKDIEFSQGSPHM